MPYRFTTGAALAAMLSTPAFSDEVVVFAAASLKDALDAVATDFEAATGHTVTISYAGSNALAKQILEGAPADIFLSAAVDWMDAVDDAGLVVEGTRTDLLGNRLVLVAHGRNAAPVELGPGFDLATLLGDGKLSLAMVDAVPAGKYAREALETLGIWASVQDSVAQSENVRAALSLVAMGEAPFGIVYATDIGASDDVTAIGAFPTESHTPIVYPGAVLTGAADAADLAFFEALSSDAGDARFRAAGFVILE